MSETREDGPRVGVSVLGAEDAELDIVEHEIRNQSANLSDLETSHTGTQALLKRHPGVKTRGHVVVDEEQVSTRLKVGARRLESTEAGIELPVETNAVLREAHVGTRAELLPNAAHGELR